MRCDFALIPIFVLASQLACSEKFEPPPKDEPEPAKVVKAAPAPAPAPTPAAAPPDARPEPTTPEELELARKAAMVEGRDDDVLRYCEKEGIESGKSDPQAVLGCTLSACRLGQKDKARAWGAELPKALKQQAFTICKANNVIL